MALRLLDAVEERRHRLVSFRVVGFYIHFCYFWFELFVVYVRQNQLFFAESEFLLILTF